MRPTPAVEIRFASAADAPLILRFIRELAAYEREPQAVQATSQDLESELRSARPSFECLLASVAGEPAGFALFFTSYSTWRGRPGMYLEDLFVPEARRRQGVGRALFARLGAICAERGYARLEWAVLNWNELAMSFYRGLGAEPQSEWTTWRLGGDALRRLGTARSG